MTEILKTPNKTQNPITIRELFSKYRNPEVLPDQGVHYGQYIPQNKNTFRCIFVNEKFCILLETSLKFVPKGHIDNKTSTGLENGLAPNRRQAITWTIAIPVHWRICGIYIYGTRGKWVEHKLPIVSVKIYISHIGIPP